MFILGFVIWLVFVLWFCFVLILKLVHTQYIKVEMATPSSILAGTIPWTEEPGGLQSMGSPRVGHN